MTKDKDHISFEALAFGEVTPKGFSDVSIITGDMEAGGHGVYVDEKTIEQFMACVIGKTVSAYLTHEDAWQDRLGDEIGIFSGFYRDGVKVRAKNFKFLQAFIDNEPEDYATLTELAKNYPDQLGISPVISSACVWVMKSGDEIPCMDPFDIPEGAIRDMPSLRVMSVRSCDFVKQPAANLALFSKVDVKPNNNPLTMPADTILLSKHTEEITSLQTQHKDALTELETKHAAAITSLEAKVTEFTAQLAKATEEAKGLTQALAAKTKEAEEAAKYDMRKAGGEALEVALESRKPKIPKPAATDKMKWEQYHSLLSAEKLDEAAAFKAQYLTRK